MGYARVYPPDQNLSTQIELLKEHGCEKIFNDNASDIQDDQKGLNEILSYFSRDDVVLSIQNRSYFPLFKKYD